jgi:hypothetical protein
MALEKHHENALRGRLDELFLTGGTYIAWFELVHWFNVERIAKKPYREIHEMWEETCNRRGSKVLPVEVRGLGASNPIGGIRLLRAYDAQIDGEKQRLSDLIV